MSRKKPGKKPTLHVKTKRTAIGKSAEETSTLSVAVSPAKLAKLVKLPLDKEIIARRGELDQQREAAEIVRQRHEKKLMARKGVVGIDVGLKMKNDAFVRPARYVLRVHVEFKLGEDLLRSTSVLPTSIEGIDVDVLERRYQQGADGAQPELRQFRDPISGGVAITGDQGATFGTLGMRVFLKGKPMYLTNAHVVPKVGEDVFQPPTKGPGTPIDSVRVIGKVSKLRERNQDCDCALIQATGSRGFAGLVLGIPTTAKYAIGFLENADVNVTKLFKIGAKTGSNPKLLGTVDNINASVSVDGFAYVGQITVRGDVPGVFADQGDSGSILLRKRTDQPNSYEIVGLVHASTADKRTAVACDFEVVADALKFKLTP